MINQPVVTIVCLCYNQADFVEEAITSALNQTYKSIQLIVVDDGSTDNSPQLIRQLIADHPDVLFLPLPQNLGNCTAFNRTMPHIKGEFIIDLAADDLLHPTRVEEGVKALLENGKRGVNFCNAEIINEDGRFLRNHYAIDKKGKAIEAIPDGDVFVEVIKRYFICPPTIMFRADLFTSLGGYDEQLTYEDFDFWVRSSRVAEYCYTDQVLMKKREVNGSLGQLQFKLRSPHLYSTYKICTKAAGLVETKHEKQVLKKRLLYEIRVACRYLNFKLAYKFYRLWRGI